MDGLRFDGVARLLAAGTTRRGGIKAALGVVFGGAGVEAVGDSASAAPTRCRRGRQTCQRDNQCCSGTCNRGPQVALRDRNRCACEDGAQQCGNACVVTNSDERNCGACGVRCQAAEVCCNGECIDVRDDEFNCGACGTICAETETCIAGVCLCIPDCEGTCGDDGCGGKCGEEPYLSLDDGSCVDADTYCSSQVWRTGDRADCMISPDGEVMFACYNQAAGFAYDWGAHCAQTSDCEDWCDDEENVGCLCLTRYYNENLVPAFENYAGEGNYCIRKTMNPFGLEEAIAGDCEDWLG